MTAARRGVDIGVGEVDPARETDIPVDHADLPVVAVVEPRRENGQKPVEYAAADALGFERVLIALRQLVHTAEIIVHHAHVQTRLRLPAEYVVNGVPHFSGGDDVVFHEDKLFRFFQLREKRGKVGFADREIRRLGMRECRRERGAAQILGNAHGVGVGGQRRLRGQNGVHRFFVLRVDACHPFLFSWRKLVFSEHEKEQRAEHRQREDRDDPRDLILRAAVAADEIENLCGGKDKTDAVKNHKMLVEPRNGEKNGGKLQRNEYAGKYRPGKNDLEKVLHADLR